MRLTDFLASPMTPRRIHLAQTCLTQDSVYRIWSSLLGTLSDTISNRVVAEALTSGVRLKTGKTTLLVSLDGILVNTGFCREGLDKQYHT